MTQAKWTMRWQVSIACTLALTSWTACSTDSATPSAGSGRKLSSSRQSIYGPNTTRDDGANVGGDSFFADTVVSVQTTLGKCSGILVTPRLVLTSAHCFADDSLSGTIGIGPNKDLPKRGIPVPTGGVVRMSDGTEADTDIALLRLPSPVMDIADSRRPLNWNSWIPEDLTTEIFGDSTARFGIAGWSPYSGEYDCLAGNEGPVDAEHQTWRQHAQQMNQDSFRRAQYSSNAILWDDSNANKFQGGDSGGPLYYMLNPPSGVRRQVIGVASRNECSLLPDLTFARVNKFTDVTKGATASFIAANGDDGRSADWLARHAKTSHWLGEVDYLGPCTTPNGYGIPDGGEVPFDQDLDCDHWYDVHDDCPRDYNPGQEEDASGKGLACKNRGSLDDYNPSNPQPVEKTIDLGVCTSDQPGCPIGICGFQEISGQFFQSAASAPRFDDPDFRGSYIRLNAGSGQYQLQLGIKPHSGPESETYMPPTGMPSCLALQDIVSIPNPQTCELGRTSLQSAGTPKTSSLAVPDPLGVNSIVIMSGFIGNIGFPGTETQLGRTGYVKVNNVGTPLRSLMHRRDETTVVNHRAFTAQAFTLTCPGWTPSYAVSTEQVTASSIPATKVLVSGGATTSRCFITGLGGPWGGWSPTFSQPSARIHTDPVSGDILLTVSPSGAPGTLQTVDAWATCINLN